MNGNRETTGPTRQLRVLARWAPGAAVAFGLLALWSAVSVVRNLTTLVEVLSGAGPAYPVLAVVLGVAVSALVAGFAGLVAYRLGVEVPRTLRGWRVALAERAEARTGS
ncbi:hypothetical protein [Microlunatus spumicola]